MSEDQGASKRMALTKDIGKVAERVGKLETGVEAINTQLVTLNAQLVTMASHNAQVCMAAKLLIFCITKLIPALAAVGAILLALDHFGKL